MASKQPLPCLSRDLPCIRKGRPSTLPAQSPHRKQSLSSPASNTPMAFQSLPDAVGSQKRKPSISLWDPCHLPALHTRSQAVPCLYYEHVSPISSPSTTYQRSREPLSPLCLPCRLSPGASLHLFTGLFDHYILPTLQSVPKSSWAGLSTLSW